MAQDISRVFICDFGLAKKHLDSHKNPVPPRKRADFRGTVSFASLNAHNNIDLGRVDDMWSFYFTMLDFLNEKLNWRETKGSKCHDMDEVKQLKD
jgi:tau tubulin kinase